MECYHCHTPIRISTIICPVCNRPQNLSRLERLVDSVKRLILERNVRNRPFQLYR